MLEKLAEVEKRYGELDRLLADPKLLSNQREYTKVAKERADLEEVITCYRQWRKVDKEIEENRELLNEKDEALRELAKEELVGLQTTPEDVIPSETMVEVQTAILDSQKKYQQVGVLLLEWLDTGETSFPNSLALEMAELIGEGVILSSEAVTLLTETIK